MKDSDQATMTATEAMQQGVLQMMEPTVSDKLWVETVQAVLASDVGRDAKERLVSELLKIRRPASLVTYVA